MEVAMQQIFNQLLQFLQQGIAAIFRFVQLIWTWSSDQIIKVFNAPWGNWPFWKQILLVVLVGYLIYLLYKAGKELWESGEKALAAFAALLSAFVKVLPRLFLAGVVALVGLWFLNTADLSKVRLNWSWADSPR
jgi:hypothetical protein